MTPKEKAKKAPKSPGVYFFYDNKGKIIYIGKAAILKNRLASYFQKSTTFSAAKIAMKKAIAKVDWQEVDSEIEALLLETALIKKHKPRFNVLMRDDKSFVYIKVSTEEPYPRIFTTRRLEKKGRYFGPFTSARAVNETLKVIRKMFPYRTKCKPGQTKPCFHYQIGLCPGTCVDTISKTAYQGRIRMIINFLEGKKNAVVKEMNKQLREAKKQKNDDKVLELEQRIGFMDHVLAHAHVISFGEKYEIDLRELARVLNLTQLPHRIEGYDISNIQGKQAVGSMVVFADGDAAKHEYRKFKIKLTKEEPNDVAMMREVFDRRFARIGDSNKKQWSMPDLIIVDGGKGQLNAATRILKKYKLNIPIISLAKREEEIFFPGEKKPLVLPKSAPALHLVMRVRDEAHRFAVAYHRQLRSKKLLK